MNVDRTLLPHTFGPWFGRFTALTRVQQESIPHIVQGRDVLICAATASGKTEAYAAPAAERALAYDNAPATVIIIAPTRALANDLHRRLESPMSLVHVSFGRYTGEHKERTKGTMRAVVVVTPEALDSLISRRARVLAATRLVIIDEVHVLDGTARGDQLRVLLYRLANALAHPLQRVAASATVDRPRELGARYLVKPELVIVPGARKLVGRGFDGRHPEAMGAHLDALVEHGFKKVLVFCRGRNQVETLSSKLAGRTRFGDAVYAHHGSLAKIQRERTERHFLTAQAGVCFATLTLEMGLDIGTVDYVLLADVPADVASLLQRIGRGGRRGDTTRFGFVVANAAEQHVLRTMVLLGKEGHLAARPYGFRPSVFVQQSLTVACQSGYIEAADVDALVPPVLRSELGPHFGARLLEATHEAALLERARGGRYVPTEAIDSRHARGELHSNFETVVSQSVVDRITGDVVGEVEGIDTRKFELGGRDRNVVQSRDGRILTDAAKGGTPARFRPGNAPSISFALGRAVVEGLGVPPACVGVLAFGGEVRLAHGLGTLGELLLVVLLERSGASVATDSSGAYVTVVARAPEHLPSPTAADIAQFIEDHADKIAQLVGAGPWRRALPLEVHLQALRRMSGLDEIADWLQGARLQTLEEPREAEARVLAGL